MDIETVVAQQLLDMAKRRMRQTFRQHLSAAGMICLHHAFWIVRLLEEVEDFPVKFVGVSVPAMSCSRAATSSREVFSLRAMPRRPRKRNEIASSKVHGVCQPSAS